jgi:hypothetical protein
VAEAEVAPMLGLPKVADQVAVAVAVENLLI